MPSIFSSVTGRNCYTLFEIRLENDFIVFRGNEHESAGQLLKGTVVLCLPAPLKVDDIHLRLTGTRRFTWAESRLTASGVSNQKVDKTDTILLHRWAPFVGGVSGKSTTLPAGNYEWPFEYTLRGNTPESVEGLPEASITYRLKATVARGKLAYDLHAYKHLRIIRTLEPAALEFLHAMSVENIWPNKVDYSIVIAQKAIVFGAVVPVSMRFTPLLKGLEMGTISAKMIEVRECCLQGSTGLAAREHRTERVVASWKFEVTREDHWQNMIEDTGQDGWVVEKGLDLPRRLRQCVQDLNHSGIKVRHKIKLTVALTNPDGHVSELRATLPVSIFISPNRPLDEQGNLVSQAPEAAVPDTDPGAIAPPGYGEHVLDQLYENVVDGSGFQTPAAPSGANSPYYSQSRAESSENLTSAGNAGNASNNAITAAALSSRLQNVGVSQRNSSALSLPGSRPQSSPLSRSNSDDGSASGRSSPEHVDCPDVAELSKVPSYATAVRTPARSRAFSDGVMLPNYEAAVSVPDTPGGSPPDHLFPILEGPLGENRTGSGLLGSRSLRTASWSRPLSAGFMLPRALPGDERRQLYMLQATS